MGQMAKSKEEIEAQTQPLEERIESLEKRIQALEDVFSPAILDRQTSHVEAKEKDARDELNVGDVKTIKIFDPPGAGTNPDRGIGKIKGIVTFVNCEGLNVSKNDVVHCRITGVSPNAAQAVATQMTEYDHS